MKAEKTLDSSQFGTPTSKKGLLKSRLLIEYNSKHALSILELHYKNITPLRQSESSQPKM